METSNRTSTLAREGGDRASDGATSTPAILIVDDEPLIVDVLAALLEDEGFRVLRAYDGEQAWSLASSRRPALVISDIYMPRLTGIELLDRLRNRPALACIPVILMSAARREIVVPGAQFMPKPFDLNRLLSLVHNSLAA